MLNYVCPQSLGSAGNSNIHPAVIKLGVQYAKGIICGSNARCVALLLAFKKVRRLPWLLYERLRSSLYMSQVAYHAYSALCSKEWLGVFLLPPGWDANPLQGYPPALHLLVPLCTCTPTFLYTWVKIGACIVREERLAQEHNTMSLARAQTRTAWSRVERSNQLRPTHLRMTVVQSFSFFAVDIRNSKFS